MDCEFELFVVVGAEALLLRSDLIVIGHHFSDQQLEVPLRDAESPEHYSQLLGSLLAEDALLGESFAAHDHALGDVFLQVFVSVDELLADRLLPAVVLLDLQLPALGNMQVDHLHQRKQEVLRWHLYAYRIHQH